MKLVIDIDERVLNDAKNGHVRLSEIADAVLNGTPVQTGEWGKWVISEIRCPKCLEYFQVDCYSTEELKKCPNCGVGMRGDTE